MSGSGGWMPYPINYGSSGGINGIDIPDARHIPFSYVGIPKGIPNLDDDGLVPTFQLPAGLPSVVSPPEVSRLGGIFLKAPASSHFVNGVDDTGALVTAQPATTDISDFNSGVTSLALPLATGGAIGGALGFGASLPTVNWAISHTDGGAKFRINQGGTFGTNDALVIDSLRNIGIGTAAPTARMQIQNINSLISGISINQTGPTTGSVAGPLFLNSISSSFNCEITGAVGTGVAAFHASLGVGGPNLAGQEFYGGSFGVTQTSADTAVGDKVGVSAGVVIPFSSAGKCYGASFSHNVSGTGNPDVAVGVEVDSSITGTGAAGDRVGFHALNLGTNTATNFEAAFAVGCSGAAGTGAGSWKNLIGLYTSGGTRNRALQPTGSFFISDNTTSIANIFNLSNVNVTNDILLFPFVELTGFGQLILGGQAPTARLDIAPGINLPSWTTSGGALRVRSGLYTDTTGIGTIATRVGSSFGQPTFSSVNTVDLTAAITLYIAGPPIAGTNTTIENAAALIIAGGNVGFNTTAPIANLQLTQIGNLWSNGFVFARSGTTTASLYLDATDGTFNIGRTNTNTKYFSMDASGNVNFPLNVGIGTTIPGAKVQITQSGDNPNNGVFLARGGAALTAIWLDAADNSFNIGRTGAPLKNFSMDVSGNVSFINNIIASSDIYITGKLGLNTNAPVAQIQLSQTGDNATDGFIFSRVGTPTASFFLDATDGSFNIGRTNGNLKYLSLSNAGDISLSENLNVAGDGIFSGNLGVGPNTPGATIQLSQISDDAADGFFFSRAGTSIAALWLDATDGTFNIGRTGAPVKNFSMDASGNITALESLAVGAAGPTWTSGSGVPSSTQPKGSFYTRTGGAVGSTYYVTQGGGVWNAVAGV